MVKDARKTNRIKLLRKFSRSLIRYSKVKELLIPFDSVFREDLDRDDGGCLGMGFILRLVSSGSNLQKEKLA